VTRSLWAATLLVCAGVAGCRAAAPAAEAASGPSALTPAEEAQIRAADSLFAVGTNTGDADRVAGVYAEDALLMPPNAPPIKGRAAIREFWNGLLQPYAVVITLGTDQIEGRGDLAYVVGHYRFVTTPKAKGTPAMSPEDGKFLEVFKRQPDGSWRYVADMYSPNAAPK
jgi:uncharacterized protein (TIGR02246 family)